MRRGILVAALAAVALAVVTPVSLAREDTTSPGYNFYIGVYITEIGGLNTPVIKPGGKSRLGAQLDERGQYTYRVDKKARGYFTVI
jgi:hypothetical protein